VTAADVADGREGAAQVTGKAIHPCCAKGKLVNALFLVAALVAGACVASCCGPSKTETHVNSGSIIITSTVVLWLPYTSTSIPIKPSFSTIRHVLLLSKFFLQLSRTRS